MILRSICVQGWRCFADPVEVGPFADGLNVLHAPNATGKSTLFEALLRSLLDGHRVTGREVEALRPWGRELIPTVTVELAHGGAEYRLTKRFLDRPASEFYRREGGRFVRLAEGDAADERVREILTRNPPGRGLARPDNWGLAQVLWAPQGSLALGGLTGDVVADIRTSLGVQVAGPGSGPLEQRIEEAYGRYFTPGGRFRTGKDAPPLVKLREELKAALEARRTAQSQQQAFEEAARRVEDLRARRAQARRDAEALSKTLTETRARAQAYMKLVAEGEKHKEKVEAEEAKYNALRQQIEAIRNIEKELATARETMVRLEADAPLRAREVEDRQKAEADARKALEDIRKGREVVAAAEERAKQANRYVRAREGLTALDDRLQRITAATETLENRKKQRAALVAPDEKALRAMRKAMKDRDEAQVRLDAALISLEVVPQKDGALEVISGEQTGKQLLRAGLPTEVKGSPEVVVDLPGVARIRARGPTGPIADLRTARDRAAQRLVELTQGYGTSEIETLESLSAKARALDGGVAEAETQIKTLLAEETLEGIQAERARLAGSLDEIGKSHPEWRDSPPDAEALEVKARQIRDSFIEQIEVAEKAWTTAKEALSAAREQSASVGAQFHETEHRLKILESRLAELTADAKQTAEREAELRQIALAWEAARAGLDKIEKELREFGEDPGKEVPRLEKQLQAADEAASKALEEEKRQEGLLEHLCALGPYSVLARAEEEVVRLQRELAAEELRVAAIRLLHEMVAQCRTEAVAAVAAPVEAAATRTMQRIAGGRLGQIRLGETFEPEHLVPEMAGTPVPLDNASGGEREQIYLATRLALAEVLARDERQLVVLDDVLTATDSGRLTRVMAILEEAAQRLQILILTCHPERYRGLEGANFVDLEAILHSSPAA